MLEYMKSYSVQLSNKLIINHDGRLGPYGAQASFGNGKVRCHDGREVACIVNETSNCHDGLQNARLSDASALTNLGHDCTTRNFQHD